MARDPLTTLIKVRRLAIDDAQRRVVDALANEDRAEKTVQQIERNIANELAAASNPECSDSVVEAFGAWLPGARRNLATSRQTLLGLQAETMRCRAELTAYRTALETVESLQAQRRETARKTLEKIYERELDDRRQPNREFGHSAD